MSISDVSVTKQGWLISTTKFSLYSARVVTWRDFISNGRRSIATAQDQPIGAHALIIIYIFQAGYQKTRS